MEALAMMIVSLAAMGVVVFSAGFAVLMSQQRQPVQVRARAPATGSQGPLKEGLMGLVKFGWLPERMAGRALQQAETSGFERVYSTTMAGLIFVVLMSTQLTQAAA